MNISEPAGHIKRVLEKFLNNNYTIKPNDKRRQFLPNYTNRSRLVGKVGFT